MWKLCVVLFLQFVDCSSNSTNRCVEVTLRNTPSESLTVSEGSTLDLTFTLNNVCSGKDALTNYTIFIDKPTKDATQLGRMCQFVHGNNGSCLLASPPQHCACGSSGLYTVTLTSDRSHAGRWKWSSNPEWLKEKAINVNVTVKPGLLDLRLSVNGSPVDVVQENSTVDVTCTFDVGNQPGYKADPVLRKEATSLTGKGGPTYISHTFTSVSCEDMGIITCEMDSAGQNKTVPLLVKCKPMISTSKSDQFIAAAGTSLEVSVPFRSYTKQIPKCQYEFIGHGLDELIRHCNVDVTGTPPDLTASVKLVATTREGNWTLQLYLSNFAGTGMVKFDVLVTKQQDTTNPTVTAIVFIGKEDDRSRSADENIMQSSNFDFILLGAILSSFVIMLVLFALLFRFIHNKRGGGSAEQLPPIPCRFRPQPDPDALEMILRRLAQPQPVGITNPPTQDGAVLPDRGVMTLSLDSDPFYFEIPEKRDGRARAPHVVRQPPIRRPVSTLYPSSDEASARPVSTLYPSSDYDSEAFWCPSRVVKSWPSDDSDGHVDSTSSSNASTESSTACAVRIEPAASDYMHPVATMVDRVAAWRSSGWRKTGARPTAVTQAGDDSTQPAPSCSHQDDSATADAGSDTNSPTPSEESLPIPALPQKMALRPRPPAQHPTAASEVSRNFREEGATATEAPSDFREDGATATEVPIGSSEDGATATACPQPDAGACLVHPWKPFADDYLTTPVYSRQERLELLKRQQAEEERKALNFATESERSTLSAEHTTQKATPSFFATPLQTANQSDANV